MFKLLVVFIIVLQTARSDDVDYRKLYIETLRKYAGNSGSYPDQSNQLILVQRFTEIVSDEAHYRAFKEHAKRVFAHNALPDKEWSAAINHFTLETDEEQDMHLGLNISLADHLPGNRDGEQSVVELQSEGTTQVSVPRSTLELQGSIDYRSKMNPIKSQGICGSCWAFAAAATLEYQLNRNKETSDDFAVISEQEYTSCSYGAGRNGCAGGWPDKCFIWSKRNDNYISSSQDYPYTDRGRRTASQCLHDPENNPNAMSGYKFKKTARYVSGHRSLRQAVANPSVGVLVAAIAVVRDFYDYNDGVYSSPVCSERHSSVNHAVNVVGYGTDSATGSPYWLIRNSWGTDWGEQGYMKMKRGPGNRNLNMCQVSDYTHYPSVTSEDTENESSCTWVKKAKRRIKSLVTKMNKDYQTAVYECEHSRDVCGGIVCRSMKKCGLVGKENLKLKRSRKYKTYLMECLST